MNRYSNWEDVKAKARAVDTRTPAERAVAKQAARERTEAYVRGHQLAEMRKAAGITQVRLAELLQVSQARISKIESGEVSGIEIIRSSQSTTSTNHAPTA